MKDLIKVRPITLHCSNPSCGDNFRIIAPMSVSRQEVLYRSGWFKFLGKPYCPKCKTYGQELDAQMQKQKREKYLAKIQAT